MILKTKTFKISVSIDHYTFDEDCTFIEVVDTVLEIEAKTARQAEAYAQSRAIGMNDAFIKARYPGKTEKELVIMSNCPVEGDSDDDFAEAYIDLIQADLYVWEV